MRSSSAQTALSERDRPFSSHKRGWEGGGRAGKMGPRLDNPLPYVLRALLRERLTEPLRRIEHGDPSRLRLLHIAVHSIILLFERVVRCSWGVACACGAAS